MKRDPFLGLLLLVARAHGATSDQIEQALAGDSSWEAQADLLDRLHRDGTRVTRRHPPLTRFAVAGLSRAAMEGLSRLGVKTNRDLFLETEERLRTAGGLGDAEIAEIERFVRRSGYRLGMTADEAGARAKSWRRSSRRAWRRSDSAHVSPMRSPISASSPSGAYALFRKRGC